VNDAPIVVEPLNDLLILEDSGVATVVLSQNFDDLDGDTLIYNASINAEGIISIDIHADTLTISTLPDKFGGPITIIVSIDDQNIEMPIVDQFNVIIEPVNDHPIITSVPELTAWEDIEFTYQILVEDVDNKL
jgi:hypothetical protein